MMKFAKTKYNSFSIRVLGLSVSKGEVFAVTKEIEGNQAFQDGVATKNITFVEIRNAYELSKVVNISPAIESEFNKNVPKPEVKAAEPKVEKPKPKAVEPVPEAIEDDVMVLAFTEEAGNVKNALKAISKQTDIKKLEFALEHDERKSVKKAIQNRIEELK